MWFVDFPQDNHRFVFRELKLTNHLLDQDVRVFKSLLRMSADSIALSTIRNILVSSATSLIMNKQKLEDVKFHKHLGVTISDDGSWNKHIELVIDKAYSID
jgi:hypothetical protein